LGADGAAFLTDDRSLIQEIADARFVAVDDTSFQ